MGAGIARVTALSGYKTILYDERADVTSAAVAQIDGALRRKAAEGQKADGARDRGLGTIQAVPELSGCEPADLVVEAITEQQDLKEELFRRLNAICAPETILSSNTSSVPITALARASGRAERFVGIHFMNPAPKIKGVEIIPGRLTSSEVVAAATEFVESLEKVAVLARDYSGFITSRLIAIYLNEAAREVMDGNEPEMVDKAMLHCFNMPIGPCELLDLVGIDVVVHALTVMTRDFGERFQPAPLLRQMVFAGQLGRKAGQGFYRYDTTSR